MGNLKYALILAGVWLLCVIAAVRIDPSRPTCGGETMVPGDRCTHYGNGSSWTSTYQDEVAGSARLRLAATAGVVLVPLAGAAFALWTRRRRRSRAVAARPAAPRRASPPSATSRPRPARLPPSPRPTVPPRASPPTAPRPSPPVLPRPAPPHPGDAADVHGPSVPPPPRAD